MRLFGTLLFPGHLILLFLGKLIAIFPGRLLLLLVGRRVLLRLDRTLLLFLGRFLMVFPGRPPTPEFQIQPSWLFDSVCVARISVLKVMFTNCQHSDPKQFFRDTKKKLAGIPSAHCLPDVMAAFQTACHA